MRHEGPAPAVPKRTSTIIAIAGIAVAVLLAVLVFQNARSRAGPELTVPYHGVLLTNGQAFFGRLENAGSAFPVLREVYYIRSQTNANTKEVTNTLVKRGQEWHAPDAMILNASHVVLIEPVKPDSKVGQLIEQSRRSGTDMPQGK